MNASLSLAYLGWLLASSSLITRVFQPLDSQTRRQFAMRFWFAACSSIDSEMVEKYVCIVQESDTSLLALFVSRLLVLLRSSGDELLVMVRGPVEGRFSALRAASLVPGVEELAGSVTPTAL